MFFNCLFENLEVIIYVCVFIILIVFFFVLILFKKDGRFVFEIVLLLLEWDEDVVNFNWNRVRVLFVKFNCKFLVIF